MNEKRQQERQNESMYVVVEGIHTLGGMGQRIIHSMQQWW